LTKRKTIIKILIILAALAVTAILAVTVYLNPFIIQRPAEETIWTNHERTRTDFDVIVVGAEPEGIAAAVAASRNGMNTLLLERGNALGGLMTLGQLNFIDMCHGRDGTLLTRGIFEEFYNAVGGTAFDITTAKNYFLGIVAAEPLLTLRTQSHLLAPVMDGNSIIGVRMHEDGEEVVYTARRFIDATADADLAAMAGAPYTIGGEDIGEKDRKMGVTLVYELSGVSWTRIFFHLNTQRLMGILTGNPVMVGATNRVAWGYEEEGLAYVPNDPTIRFRGPNIARQRDGSVLINALVIFDVDPLDPVSYQDAIDRAKDELELLLPYMRENMAGFRNAELSATASRLYVRESRHIIGEYLLTIDDVLENRDQWDKIAIGSYPADVQASILQPLGTVIGVPDRFAVPFRSLVPLYIDGLLVVGRSASFTSQAASSARVIPLGMACGQAAGAAAAQSVRENQVFRDISRDAEAIARLQSTLRSQGAFLDGFTIHEPIMSHWAYEGLAALRRIGLMAGGYNNDYMLEEPMYRWRFQSLINGVADRSDYNIGTIRINDPTTNSRIIDVVAEVLLTAEYQKAQMSSTSASQEIGTQVTPGAPGTGFGGDDDTTWPGSGRAHSENLTLLTEAGILSTELLGYFTDGNKIPQAAEVVMLLANLHSWLN